MNDLEAKYLERVRRIPFDRIAGSQKDFEMQGVYINDEKRFMLYWNPKASCTSLAYWYISNRLGHDLSDQEFTTYRYLDGYYYKGKHVREMAQYQDYERLLFIRNPFRRIVSLYYNKFVNYPEKGWLLAYSDLEKVGKRVVDDIYSRQGRNPLVEYNGITFNTLLDWIWSRHFAIPVDTELNFHFSSQVKRVQLSLEMIKNFTFVFKTDVQDKHLDFLNRHYGFNRIPRKMNSSGLTSDEKKSDLSGVLPSEIAKYANISYHDFLNERNLETMFNLYLEDVYAYSVIAQ